MLTVLFGQSPEQIAAALHKECPTGARISRTITPFSVRVRKALQDPATIRNKQIRAKVLRDNGREIWLKVADGIEMGGIRVPSCWFQLDHVLSVRCDHQDGVFCVLRTGDHDLQGPLMLVNAARLCRNSRDAARLLTEETMESLTSRLNGDLSRATKAATAS